MVKKGRTNVPSITRKPPMHKPMIVTDKKKQAMKDACRRHVRSYE